jgi:hypothetical protein
MQKDDMTGTLITLGIVGAAAYLLYEWLSSSCATNPTGFLCGVFGMGAPAVSAQTPTTQTSSSGAASTSTQAPAAVATTAVLTDITRPAGPFQAGDSFQLVITGPPNSQVIGTGSQNGAVSSSTNFGNTNANGTLIITGTWSAQNVGQWVESWQVGNSSPFPLSFTIQPAGGTSGINRIPAGLINGAYL